MMSNQPVMVSQDRVEYEFWIEKKNRKAVFIVRDTASKNKIQISNSIQYTRCIMASKSWLIKIKHLP